MQCKIENEYGLTAQEALDHLAKCDPDRELWSGDTMLDDWMRRHDLLKYRLRDGTWYATGYLAPFGPSSKNERLPAHLWDVLDISAAHNSAAGGGLEYVGVRIHKNRPRPESPPVPDAPRSMYKKDVDDAYAARVEQFLKEEGRKPTRREDEEWGRNNGFSRDRVRKLRRTTRTQKERMGGAPKKKTRLKN